MFNNFKMLIDGKYVDAQSGKTYGVINPATGKEIGSFPLGGLAEVDMAVAAARKAFPEWSGKTQAERSAIVNRIGELIRKHLDELIELDMLDHGTPHLPASHLTVMGAGQFEFSAQAARGLYSDVIPIRHDALHFFLREPIGVAALIVPWNVPFVMTCVKLSAAMVVGNTCVVKPPSVDTVPVLKLGEILAEAGVPDGVVNIITGPGGTVGDALIAHPGVDVISFTGSTETGKQIMSRAFGKRLFMELGGKNPFIVLPDANLDAAVEKGVFCAFANSGMICAAPGRFYIHKDIYDEFVGKFVEASKTWTVGDPMDEKTMMGPVVSAEHRDSVERYIEIGNREGARLLLGGKRPTEPPLNNGFFVAATVFADVKQNMTIAREEIFGPVAVLIKYDSEDEIVGLANDSRQALCASIWTKDIAKAMRYAKQIQAGTFYINDHLTICAEMPWGGFKESGFGKENGMVTFEQYTQLKLVAMEL